jgi:hypothetical protein
MELWAEVVRKRSLQVELWAAVYRSDTFDVLRLLKDGADIEDCEGLGSDRNDGGGALHWAVLYGSVGVIFTLIVHGADLDRKNRRGHSPIELAMLKKEQIGDDGTFELYTFIITILQEEADYRREYTQALHTPSLADNVFAKHETVVLEARRMSVARIFVEQSAKARLHRAYPRF